MADMIKQSLNAVYCLIGQMLNWSINSIIIIFWWFSFNGKINGKKEMENVSINVHSRILYTFWSQDSWQYLLKGQSSSLRIETECNVNSVRCASDLFNVYRAIERLMNVIMF